MLSKLYMDDNVDGFLRELKVSKAAERNPRKSLLKLCPILILMLRALDGCV